MTWKPAKLRISYLIGNMAAEPSYQGLVENDEKKLLMQVYMTVTNTSGESLGECTLTIKEHVDGEWIIEKVVLKELVGERNAQQEKEIPHGELFQVKRIDVANVEFEMKLPPTTIDKKYDLFVTILRKYRRY